MSIDLYATNPSHVRAVKTATSEMALYDASTIDRLEWPETEEGHYAKRFLVPFVKNGIHHYIDNIHGDIFVLKIDSFIFPVVVPDANRANSYICSPYNHYIACGKEHTALIDNPLLAPLINPLLCTLGKFGEAAHIDSVVYVNHWLNSTDLYPEGMRNRHLSAILALLKQRFPGRAIIFRSLNKLTSGSMLHNLKNLGFHMIASRHVWITNAKREEVFQTRILKSDLKLWNHQPYEILDEPFKDAARFWMEHPFIRYSSLQPQFNRDYLNLMLEQRLLDFKILTHEGTIKGLAGYHQRNSALYCPFFIYDKEDPEHKTIYRLLNTSLLLEAKKRGVFFNQSTGAAFYKSIRRAEGCQEFMGVYTQHLSMKQKAAWSLLSLVVNTLAPRYMRKY